MKLQTENAVRIILTESARLTREQTDDIIHVLMHGRRSPGGPDRVIRFREAADLLGLPYHTAFRYARLGMLETIRIHGKRRIGVTYASIYRFIYGRKPPSRDITSPVDGRIVEAIRDLLILDGEITSQVIKYAIGLLTCDQSTPGSCCDFLTTREAARILGVSSTSIRRMVETSVLNKLDNTPATRRIFITRESIMALTNRRKEKTNDQPTKPLR